MALPTARPDWSPSRGRPTGHRRLGIGAPAPVRTAVLLGLAWLVFVAGLGIAASVLVPRSTGMQRAFLVEVLVSAAVVGVVARRGLEATIGPTGRTRGADVRLLAVPALLAVAPLFAGLAPTPLTTVVVLVIGYALTGLSEELWFRGVVLHVLRPTGPATSVAVSSMLFGAVHLGNVVFRDDPSLVVFQALGAACFGVGYAALRLRTRSIWPLVALHALGDLTAQLGAGPTIPILVASDVVLLVVGLVLLRRLRRPDPAPPHRLA